MRDRLSSQIFFLHDFYFSSWTRRIRHNIFFPLFHVFAPYAQQYYNVGLQLPTRCKTEFAASIADQDEWSDFFDNNVQQSNGSCAYRQDIMNRVDQCFGAGAKVFRTEVKHECKKRGYTYNSRKNTICNGIQKKGAVVSCMLI